MREMMQNMREAALKAILESEDVDSLESLRVRYLGKKGELTGILRQMGKLSAEERPRMGQHSLWRPGSPQGSLRCRGNRPALQILLLRPGRAAWLQ